MMNIVYISVDEIIPYEKNPRINDAAVDAVAQSIKNSDSVFQLCLTKTTS